ncbi:unnamed protein product [Soboliphyme baturini]|uniref:acetyl-CoA C-acetyltransferase n=1 Tax=Soboliphyme baturini TaxID=241478 RepID=A0A183IKZ1_9BILA|nr:unnamed protein product [Soboliphyme baturini]
MLTLLVKVRTLARSAMPSLVPVFRMVSSRGGKNFVLGNSGLVSWTMSTTDIPKQVKEVFIVSACRTPIGSFRSAFASMKAAELGSVAIKAAVKRAAIKPDLVQEVYMGNVLQAGVGQAPARQACLGAGLSVNVPATTINKVCASGLKAVMLGTQNLMCGQQEVMVVGGMESMSNVPFYIPRGEIPYGGGRMIDGLVHDGLWDAYKDIHMGECAENTASILKITREDQDVYAFESYRRAAAAWANGVYANEVIPVTVKQPNGVDRVISEDEEYTKVKFDKFSTLRPAFKKDGGTITAANASTLSDGACALVLMTAEAADKAHVKPLAKVVAFADASVQPIDFPVAPSHAMQKILNQCELDKSAIGLWEINEAFSVVALANIKLMGLKPDLVNVHGGAVSLGHPLGMSGARLVTHLVHTLKHGQKGMVGICNGGGGASAMMIERL